MCADVIGADGAEGSRTPDLCSAIAALSQLSYSPVSQASDSTVIDSAAHGNGPASGAAVIASQSTSFPDLVKLDARAGRMVTESGLELIARV